MKIVTQVEFSQEELELVQKFDSFMSMICNKKYTITSDAGMKDIIQFNANLYCLRTYVQTHTAKGDDQT